MKSLLVTPVITAFVLALFLHSGSAIICYNCESAMCKTTVNCGVDQDSCITVHYGAQTKSQCWNFSDCNVNFISHYFSINTFKYRCCKWNLCNNAPNVVANKIALSGAFLLTVGHILKFLVWN